MALLLATLLATASPASGCPVCYGAPDHPMTEGASNGVLFLLSIVAVVQGGFIALFLSIRRRAKRLEDQKAQFHLIDGGAE